MLASTFALAVVAFGGVHGSTLVALHALVAVSLLVAAAQSPLVLERCGRVLPIATAAALLLTAGCAGLLPLPRAVGRLLAPAWTDERPTAALGLATASADDTLASLSTVLLPAGFALAAAVWGVAAWRRSHAETAALTAAAGVIVLASAHVVGDTGELFGVFAPRYSPGRFFAPFVNPNHFGLFLVLAFPIALATSLDSDVSPARRSGAGAVAVATTLALLWAGAGTPLVVAAMQAAGIAWAKGWLRWWLTLPAAACAAASAVTIASRAGGEPAISLGNRARMWASTLHLWADHWFFGAGLGTFSDAISPYRTDHVFGAWEHAHNDGLEWLAETGVVGVALLAVAALVLRPASRPARAWPITLAVAGVAVAAQVDFPMHVPAIALGTAALVAWRLALYEERTASAPRAVRAVLVTAAVAQVLAALWQARHVVVDDASARLVEGRGDAYAHRVVRTLAPWRFELLWDEARRAQAAGDAPRAAATARAMAAGHPTDADVQRRAAVLLAAAGALDDARRSADRAVGRGPWDWRNWRTRALVIERERPTDAPAAWLDAVLAEVPEALEDGWRRLPVGLYWIAGVERGPHDIRAEVARFVYHQGDAQAAILGFERVVVERPDVPQPAYVDALVAEGRLDAARAYVAETLRHRPGDVALIRKQAELDEKAQRWAEASTAWASLESRVPEARLRAALALERAEGPARALAFLDQRALAGEQLRGREALERARMLGTLGQGAECLAALASDGLLSDPRFRAQASKVAAGCAPGARVP